LKVTVSAVTARIVSFHRRLPGPAQTEHCESGWGSLLNVMLGTELDLKRGLAAAAEAAIALFAMPLLCGLAVSGVVGLAVGGCGGRCEFRV